MNNMFENVKWTAVIADDLLEPEEFHPDQGGRWNLSKIYPN